MISEKKWLLEWLEDPTLLNKRSSLVMMVHLLLGLLSSLVLDWVDYSFSENGLVAYRGKELIHAKSLSDHLGDEKVKIFKDYALKYINDLDMPVKTYAKPFPFLIIK